MKILTPLKNIQEDARDWMNSREINGLYGINGGFFLDDPGMGKTLSLLSLIFLNTSTTTLVICPSNVITVWEEEIQKHTNLPKNKIFVYHGPKRKSKYYNEYLLPLQSGNPPLIILTSYGIIRNECVLSVPSDSLSKQMEIQAFKGESLFNHPFTRVIMDEAHFIKDRKTRASISVTHLQSSYKWVVTATPLSNHLDEDFSYFRFLGLSNDFRHWRAILPATRDAILESNLQKLAEGIETIRDWKKDLALKRDKSLLNLPKKTESVIYVNATEVERDFYDALYKYSMTRIQELQNQQAKLKNKHLKAYCKLLGTNVLVLILRLRQACLNPWFVVEQIKRVQAYLPVEKDGKPQFTLEAATKMLKFFNENKNRQDECPSCLDIEADTIAKPCGHKLCGSCWNKILSKDPTCPICRNQVIEVIPVDDLDSAEEMTIDRLLNEVDQTHLNQELEPNRFNTSSKVAVLLDLIKKNISRTKIIVVSQWIKMLNYTQKKIEEAGYQPEEITRIDGKVSLEERARIIWRFQNQENPKILLISLTCSAEGITLTRSNLLIYLDQWWNELGKPDQMSNRIHRIGQTKEVEIVHLRVKETIEDKIDHLHKRKNKIIGFSQGKESLSGLVHLVGSGSKDLGWMGKVNLLSSTEEEVVEEVV